jgi:hypothetical protein
VGSAWRDDVASVATAVEDATLIRSPGADGAGAVGPGSDLGAAMAGGVVVDAAADRLAAISRSRWLLCAGAHTTAR